jgi:hypothetical protein
MTGPPEHVFITANATVNTPRELSIASDTSNVELAEAPTSFMIGFNYTFGDISAGAEDRRFIDGLYVGMSVQASRRPFSQIAVNLGARHNPIPVLKEFLPFETFSPYVGMQWVRSEVAGDEGSEVQRRWSKPQKVFGVALNLAAAFDWLAGDDDAPK